MPTAYLYPGVYVEEKQGLSSISPIGSSVCAFLGQAPEPNAPTIRAVNNWTEYLKYFAPGTYPNMGPNNLSNAVYGFFLNGGGRCYIVNVKDSDALNNALRLLEPNDEIASIAAPGRSDPVSHEALTAFAEKMRIMCVLDPPCGVKDIELLKTVEVAAIPAKATKAKDAAGGSGTADTAPQGLHPRISPFAAFYFPCIYVVDAINPDPNNLVPCPPCGAVLGIWASVDATVGVHKAPANIPVRGAQNLDYLVTTGEQGALNPLGVNCIRFFSDRGNLVYGARTCAPQESESRYIPVRRTCNMIEKTILRQTGFVVFEPNDSHLHKRIKSVITAFLTNVWRDGALRGNTPDEAFFVKCDAETNPEESIALGQVITWIGVAPVKPAEFVIFRIAQMQSGARAEEM
jgi:phage tail sheath protein FI